MRDELPEQVESARLLIRVAKPGDGRLFHQAIAESVLELGPWLSWANPVPSQQDAEKTCRKAYARFLLNEDLMALFITRDTGNLVGGGGLHNVNWNLRHFEIGYWGRTSFARMGLITEGVRALTDHALGVLGASRVFLTTDVQNERSRRLAERAGFQLEGTLRNERLDTTGKLRNTSIYSRIPMGSRS